MPPHSRRHQQSSGKPSILHSSLSRCQPGDKVWHPGLLYKIKKILPTRYYNLLKSYLQGRHFVTKYNNETSRSYQIHSGVPQGSILGPLLYILYTSDLPTTRDTTMSTFADDTAIFATASRNLQEHLNTVQNWLKHGK